MRITALTFALCSLLNAAATDIVVADTTFAQQPKTLKMHYRLVLPHDLRQPSAELRWNVADTCNYEYARFSFDRDDTNDDWGYFTTYETGSATDNVRKKTACTPYRLMNDPFTEGFSIRISAGEGGAVLTAGVSSPVINLPMPRPLADDRRFVVLADQGTELQTSFVHATCIEAPSMSRFNDTNSLAEYINRSTDPYEGIWLYYDHDTKPERTIVGGRYTLATVADGTGAYDIIYINGAKDSGEAWPPLRIKGRLTPATFPGIYDLEWIQPSGVALPIEYGCGATFTDDLLTLQFPYWQATVRFRRHK